MVPAVEIKNTQVAHVPSEIEVAQTRILSTQWQTPGLLMAQNIIENPLVRFVGERYQSDYIQTIIVLDDDPEYLLDTIFEAEKDLYKIFSGLHFDIRVRVIPPGERIDNIERDAVIHYRRLE